METAVITCPHCGNKDDVEEPETGCLAFHVCTKCGEMISVPKDSGNCRVICEHGDRKCAVSLEAD